MPVDMIQIHYPLCKSLKLDKVYSRVYHRFFSVSNDKATLAPKDSTQRQDNLDGLGQALAGCRKGKVFPTTTLGNQLQNQGAGVQGEWGATDQQ